jgi:phage terminase large subunit-like protein
MDEALDLLSALVLEDGRRWGEAAVPVQWKDAREVLREDSPTPLHWISRSRGYSKTSDVAGMAIAVLLSQAGGRSRSYAVAADAAQAGLLIDAMSGFSSRTPELAGALLVQEQKVIATNSQATLQVVPADAASVWGARPYFLCCDELAAWHDSPRSRRVWEGVTTGLAKVPGSRGVIITTSGDPAHFSYAIRNQALDDPLWRVHEVEGPPPWMDRKRLEGERRRLPESSYRRLFLNQWSSGEDRLADEQDLEACVTLDDYPLEPRRGTRYVIGVDIGVKHDATVAAVCHSENGQVVLDRMMVWKPSRLHQVRLSVVEEWLREFAIRYNRATLRFDPSQGLQMMQGLKRAGLRVQEFSFGPTSVGKLATTLLNLIRERTLALPEDPELLDELRNVRLRESSPGVFRLDHDRNRHDDRAVALALAASYLVERPASRPARVTWIGHMLGPAPHEREAMDELRADIEDRQRALGMRR